MTYYSENKANTVFAFACVWVCGVCVYFPIFHSNAISCRSFQCQHIQAKLILLKVL